MLKNQYILVSLLCGITLTCWLWLSEVPQDTGDGLAHFFIAQHVWESPNYLLNHWGKPLFTLLAAPWAYFGYTTFVLFTILVYLSTLLVGYLITTQLAIKSRLILIFPMGLLTSLDYTANILGGMTEVFFGFIVVLSGLWLLQKRWIFFALLISFAPFARSEGQFLLPLALLILTYYRAWKAMPFLLTGFIVYAIAGGFAFNDYWWYFNQNPYRGAEEIYGQGSWSHYFDYWFVHLGLFGLTLLLLALLVFFVNLVRRKNDENRTVLLLYFGTIYFGILIVHAYLWANGKNGALGLTRLAIHGWPGVLLASIIALEAGFQKMKFQTLSLGVAIASSAWLTIDYPWIDEQPFPRMAKADERAVLHAADFVKNSENLAFKNQVYYYHPLIAYRLGVNLYDRSGVYQQKSFYPFNETYANLNHGDIVILDSHFAHRDMGFPKESISLFEQVMIFTPMNQYVHLGDTPMQVQVLRVNKRIHVARDFWNTSLIDTVLKVSSKELYTNIREIHSADFNGQYIRLRVEFSSLENPFEVLVFFVIQNAETGESITFELGKDNAWDVSLLIEQGASYKMFIHNPNGLDIVFNTQLDYSLR